MLPDVDKKLEKQVIIKMAGYLEKKGRMVSILHYITYSMSRVHCHPVFIKMSGLHPFISQLKILD